MLLLSAKWPKTSWHTGNLKMNEDLKNPSRTCFVRGENLERRYSDCWDWRIWKVRCVVNKSQKTDCERSPDKPKRWRICFSYDRWFSKIVRKETMNSKYPLWDENPPQGEWISAENLTATGKSFDLKNQKMAQKIGKTFGLLRDTSFIVIMLNREFNLRVGRRIIPYLTRLHYWAKLFRGEICDAEGRLEKSQNIWGKNKFNCIDIAGKDGFLYSITTLRANSFQWKDLKKALHLIFYEGESKHMLSRLAAQRICETKFFRQTSKSGEYEIEILSSVNPGRKKYELRMWFWSANFGESRGSEDSGDLSLRDVCLGKPRSLNKRSFNPSNVDSRCKGDNGKWMKGSHKEGAQKQKVRKVHFVALMDIRHIEKYEYIPGNVRKSNLKCGNSSETARWFLQMISGRGGWETFPSYTQSRSCTQTSQRRSTKQEEGQLRFIVAQKEANFDNVCLQSSKLTVGNRGYGTQDSKNVETKVKLSCAHLDTVASTMRVNPDLLEKQSNPMSMHPRKRLWLQQRKESFERTEFGQWFLNDIRGENIPSGLSSSSMSTSTPWQTSQWSSESSVLGCYTSSIVNGEVYNIPKITGKIVHVALSLSQKLQICKLGDIRAIRRP